MIGMKKGYSCAINRSKAVFLLPFLLCHSIPSAAFGGLVGAV